MKRTITICFYALFISLSATVAQPVIQNGNNIAPVGTAAAIYATTSVMMPGNPGANQTWNFGTLLLAHEGNAAIVAVAGTPYAATYPTANYCIAATPISGPVEYSYENIAADKHEEIASNISAGTGTDYSPNPQTQMPYPFHFGDVVGDTYLKTTGGGPFSVTLTYDGYGTLVTPFATYTNVVRVKRYYDAAHYVYDWWITSPLAKVFSYDTGNKLFTAVNNSQTLLHSISNNKNISLYPNPATDKTMLRVDNISSYTGVKMSLMNMTGIIVREVPVTNAETVISRNGLSAGMYIYSVRSNEGFIGNGKLVIE